MIRNVGAVIVGMLAGSLANIAVLMIGTLIWPLPEGLDMSNQEQMTAYAATMPAAAWAVAMLAHLSQAFAGGWVAARLGSSHPLRLALIVGGLSLVGGIINALNLQAPPWMWIEMPLYVVCAGAAGQLEVRRRG